MPRDDDDGRICQPDREEEREGEGRARGPIGVAVLPPPSNIYVSSGNGGQNVKCIMFRPGGREAQAVRGRDHGHARPHASCDEAERSCHADNERVPITASSVNPFHN